MSSKYWKSTATRPDGTAVTLFVSTTSDLLRHDLKQGYSLVMEGRRRNPFNKGESGDDAFDFAFAAFRGHCGTRKAWSGEITSIDAPPDFLHANGSRSVLPGRVFEVVTKPEYAQTLACESAA